MHVWTAKIDLFILLFCVFSSLNHILGNEKTEVSYIFVLLMRS